MSTESRWQQRVQAMERVFDQYADRVGSITHARRKHMRALLATVGLGAAALLIDAMLILQAQTATRPAILEWWAPVMAIATGLIAFASLRVAFTAHREYVNAQLLLKAEKNVVDLQFGQVQRDISEIKGDVRRISENFADFLREEAQRREDEANRRTIEHGTKRRA